MGFGNTWNLSKQFAAFPCAQPDPVIIALTFIPAVAPALLEYASLSCRDIIKARLGHQAPCGRALKGPLVKATPPSWVSLGEKLMKFEAAISRAGNYWLIADLISDTLARWTTEAYRLSGCPDAFEGAAWQYDPFTPELLVPNKPTPIAGIVKNETGQPGIAWTTGAICPRGWYVSLEFTAKARALFDTREVGITAWVERKGGIPYDFPAVRTSSGYFLTSKDAHYHLYTQAPDEAGPWEYTMYVMSDEHALAWITSGTGQATPFPQDGWGLEPLSCVTNLAQSHVDDPAGRNRPSRNPTIKGVGIPLPLPKPVRGRPGGLPRSKK